MNWAFPMATYSVSCVGAKLTLDTDPANRHHPARSQRPRPAGQKPFCPYPPWKGRSIRFRISAMAMAPMIKFLYPGCPAGGDILLGHTTHENSRAIQRPRSKRRQSVFGCAQRPALSRSAKSNPSIFHQKRACGSFLFPSGRPLSTGSFPLRRGKYLQPQTLMSALPQSSVPVPALAPCLFVDQSGEGSAALLSASAKELFMQPLRPPAFPLLLAKISSTAFLLPYRSLLV